jgi:thiamine pyrophosphate-dependent acetolactate synthase large subunit-like protein
MATDPAETEIAWGSDVVAALLRRLRIEYAALVPGASYRGLHDSIVNVLGNESPRMLVCLHEEHAVAIAHGYAKVTGKPMLAIVHSNVGLMHASMAIFNAWCDRVPILVLGAHGPVDAMKRRPWIDWIHTSTDMGALVRDFTKWDDRPGSPGAAIESIVRAYQIASTPPHGPTYVCLDAGWQEEPLEEPVALPDLTRYAPPLPPVPTPADLRRALALLQDARRPVIVVGRVSRNLDDWHRRVALAEALDARVVSTLRAGAVFPTEHRLHAGHTTQKSGIAALREADVILDLDSIDLFGLLRSAFGRDAVPATIVGVSLDRYVHKAWNADYQALAPVDLSFAASPDAVVGELLALLGREASLAPQPLAVNGSAREPRALAGDSISMAQLSSALADAFAGESVCYTRLARGLDLTQFAFRHPLDHLGADGGGGVGSGPGIAVGAALALRGRGRLAVAVIGDGDLLMGATALWTAVANEIPLLVVVVNNRSYFNDEIHQERVAERRGRPVERRSIGMRIDDPPPDLAGFARAQGAVGIGPVTRANALADALGEGLRQALAGKVALVDVVVVAPAPAGAAPSQRGFARAE